MNRCFSDLCKLFQDNKNFLIENNESFSITIKPNFVLRDNVIEVSNFPVAFANRENKKNRIYLKEVLYSGYEFYKNLINEQNVFRFMFDGHYDGDDYSKVVGYIKDVKQSDEDNGIYADFFILLSNPTGLLLKDILFGLKGDIGVSMRIFVSDNEEVPRQLVKEKYPNVILINEQYETLGKLFALSHTVDIQKGRGFLQRIDIVSMPSDNYASSSVKSRKESFVLKHNFFKSKNPSFKVKEKKPIQSIDQYLNKLELQSNSITDILSKDYKLYFLLRSYLLEKKINSKIDKEKYKKEFFKIYSSKESIINELNNNQFVIDISSIIYDLFEEDIKKKFPISSKNIPVYSILIKFFSNYF